MIDNITNDISDMVLENESNSDYDSYESGDLDGCEHEYTDESSEFDINNKLSEWVTSFNISQTAVTALLHILWQAGLDVPKDARTLLKTPDDTQLKLVPGENYYHFGVRTGIEASLKKNIDNYQIVNNLASISLNINIDGLPLFRSSNVQLWPILGCIAELPKADVFIIGLYAGSSKPLSITDFLEDFVSEMKDLIVNGFDLLGNHCLVKVNALICDAPARAYLKCIKGHGGYNACERCVQEGVYANHKMTYPECHAALRTDADFYSQKDEDHHLANMRTPLLELDIGLVLQCPLDYMHLICLGDVRRIICLWLKGDLQYRLSARTVSDISSNLIRLRNYMPREFSRRPRSLLEFKQWKATEFRQLLLYTGAVVLRDILPINMYNNFMTLSVAMICLLRPDFATNQQYCDYAERLLLNFVKDFATLYGNNQLVYNIHSTIHLAQDVRKFGSLDRISSFPFKKFLGQMKKMVRRPQNPILSGGEAFCGKNSG